MTDLDGTITLFRYEGRLVYTTVVACRQPTMAHQHLRSLERVDGTVVWQTVYVSTGHYDPIPPAMDGYALVGHEQIGDIPLLTRDRCLAPEPTT